MTCDVVNHPSTMTGPSSRPRSLPAITTISSPDILHRSIPSADSCYTDAYGGDSSSMTTNEGFSTAAATPIDSISDNCGLIQLSEPEEEVSLTQIDYHLSTLLSSTNHRLSHNMDTLISALTPGLPPNSETLESGTRSNLESCKIGVQEDVRTDSNSIKSSTGSLDQDEDSVIDQLVNDEDQTPLTLIQPGIGSDQGSHLSVKSIEHAMPVETSDQDTLSISTMEEEVPGKDAKTLVIEVVSQPAETKPLEQLASPEGESSDDIPGQLLPDKENQRTPTKTSHSDSNQAMPLLVIPSHTNEADGTEEDMGETDSVASPIFSDYASEYSRLSTEDVTIERVNKLRFNTGPFLPLIDLNAGRQQPSFNPQGLANVDEGSQCLVESSLFVSPSSESNDRMGIDEGSGGNEILPPPPKADDDPYHVEAAVDLMVAPDVKNASFTPISSPSVASEQGGFDYIVPSPAMNEIPAPEVDDIQTRESRKNSPDRIASPPANQSPTSGAESSLTYFERDGHDELTMSPFVVQPSISPVSARATDLMSFEPVGSPSPSIQGHEQCAEAPPDFSISTNVDQEDDNNISRTKSTSSQANSDITAVSHPVINPDKGVDHLPVIEDDGDDKDDSPVVDETITMPSSESAVPLDNSDDLPQSQTEAEPEFADLINDQKSSLSEAVDTVPRADSVELDREIESAIIPDPPAYCADPMARVDELILPPDSKDLNQAVESIHAEISVATDQPLEPTHTGQTPGEPELEDISSQTATNISSQADAPPTTLLPTPEQSSTEKKDEIVEDQITEVAVVEETAVTSAVHPSSSSIIEVVPPQSGLTFEPQLTRPNSAFDTRADTPRTKERQTNPTGSGLSRSMTKILSRTLNRKDVPSSDTQPLYSSTNASTPLITQEEPHPTQNQNHTALKKKRSLSALKRKVVMGWNGIKADTEPIPDLPKSPIAISELSKFPAAVTNIDNVDSTLSSPENGVESQSENGPACSNSDENDDIKKTSSHLGIHAKSVDGDAVMVTKDEEDTTPTLKPVAVNVTRSNYTPETNRYQSNHTTSKLLAPFRKHESSSPLTHQGTHLIPKADQAEPKAGGVGHSPSGLNVNVGGTLKKKKGGNGVDKGLSGFITRLLGRKNGVAGMSDDTGEKNIRVRAGK